MCVVGIVINCQFKYYQQLATPVGYGSDRNKPPPPPSFFCEGNRKMMIIAIYRLIYHWSNSRRCRWRNPSSVAIPWLQVDIESTRAVEYIHLIDIIIILLFIFLLLNCYQYYCYYNYYNYFGFCWGAIKQSACASGPGAGAAAVAVGRNYPSIIHQSISYGSSSCSPTSPPPPSSPLLLPLKVIL